MSSTVVDLAPYVRVLGRQVRVIAALTLLGLVAGIVFAVVRPSEWESTASIFVRPSPSNVSVDTQSLSPGQINPTINSLTLPDISLDTLAYLSHSNVVAQRVEAQIGNQLPANLRKPVDLMEYVQVSPPEGQQNILEVTATYPDPGVSQLIANAWANAAVGYVNETYDATSFDVGQAQKQLQAVEQKWNQAQQALDKFEATSGLPQAASRLAAEQSLLSDYQSQANQIQLNVTNAELLKSQLRSSKPGAASSLPVLLLSLSSFTSQAANVDVSQFLPPVSSLQSNQTSPQNQPNVTVAPQQPATSSLVVQPSLQSISKLTPQQQIHFIDSLISVLKTKQASLQTNIQDTQNKIGALRSRLEDLSSKRSMLIVNRDVNKNTYLNLNTLIRQQQVQNNIATQKVVLATEAIRPSKAGLPVFVLPIVGLIVGLVLGVIAAYVAEFVRRPQRSVSRRSAVESTG